MFVPLRLILKRGRRLRLSRVRGPNSWWAGFCCWWAGFCCWRAGFCGWQGGFGTSRGGFGRLRSSRGAGFCSWWAGFCGWWAGFCGWWAGFCGWWAGFCGWWAGIWGWQGGFGRLRSSRRAGCSRLLAGPCRLRGVRRGWRLRYRRRRLGYRGSSGLFFRFGGRRQLLLQFVQQ
jgi:hypothetical protein